MLVPVGVISACSWSWMSAIWDVVASTLTMNELSGSITTCPELELLELEPVEPVELEPVDPVLPDPVLLEPVLAFPVPVLPVPVLPVPVLPLPPVNRCCRWNRRSSPMWRHRSRWYCRPKPSGRPTGRSTRSSRPPEQ